MADEMTTSKLWEDIQERVRNVELADEVKVLGSRGAPIRTGRLRLPEVQGKKGNGDVGEVKRSLTKVGNSQGVHEEVGRGIGRGMGTEGRRWWE